MKRIRHAIAALLWIVGTSWAQSNPAPSQPTTVPAGTHVLMQLVSPLNTVSATDGSAVYLEITMPVIVDNHVAIPAHTHVTGTVLQERRPGRAKGRGRLRLGFTNLIFPDYHVVAIDGALQGLPESHRDRRVDAEGTLGQWTRLTVTSRRLQFLRYRERLLAYWAAGILACVWVYLEEGWGLVKHWFHVVETCPPICIPAISVDSTEHEYLFGPRIHYPKKRVSPFAHILFGASHVTSHATLPPPFPTFPINFSTSQTGFAMVTGGGVDVKISTHVIWRNQMDYFLTNLFIRWKIMRCFRQDLQFVLIERTTGELREYDLQRSPERIKINYATFFFACCA
jgi:hypothetical protein